MFKEERQVEEQNCDKKKIGKDFNQEVYFWWLRSLNWAIVVNKHPLNK